MATLRRIKTGEIVGSTRLTHGADITNNDKATISKPSVGTHGKEWASSSGNIRLEKVSPQREEAPSYEQFLSRMQQGRSAYNTIGSNALEQYRATGRMPSFPTQEETDRYSELLRQAEDWDVGRRYKSTANGAEKYNIFSGTYQNSGFDDITYDLINRNQEAIDRQLLADIQSKASLVGADSGFLKTMTDDEIDVFNYLYSAAGRDAAYTYINDISKDLNYRRRLANQETWAQLAKENPVGGSLFSVLESPLKGVSYIGQAIDFAETGAVDQNAGYNRFSAINSAIRGEVNKEIEDKWGKIGSFGYQTAMSMGDFLLNAAITGGNEALTLAIMGSGAAADTVISKKDQGYSDQRAFILGSSAGLVEMVTEKIGFDALFRTGIMGLGKEGFKRYILHNMFAEGAEEGAADILNWTLDGVYDAITGTGESEWKRRIKELEESGKDEKEAFGIAVAERMEELGLDILGGALSGGIMAGVGSSFNAVQFNRSGAELQEMGPEVVQAIIDEGLASDPSTDSYRFAEQLQQRMAAGEQIGNLELGQLYQANVQAIDQEDNAEVILSRAAREVQDGGHVSNRMATDILEDVNAVNRLTREAGLALTDDMTRSQRRSTVKNAIETLASTPPSSDTIGRKISRQDQQGAARRADVPHRVNAILSPVEQIQSAEDIRRAAQRSLGRIGAQQAVEFYNGDTAANDYYGSFAAYYQAGIQNSGADSVDTRYAGVLNAAQQAAAYQAGRADAAETLAREKQAAKFASVAGTDSGLVADDYSLSLDPDVADRIIRTSKLLGVRVRFVDSVRGGTANASISGSDILVEKNNPNPVMFILGHEWTHRLQSLAPEEYRKFRDAVAADLRYAANVEQGIYAQQGESIDYEAALDEAVANYAGRMISDSQVLDDFLEQHRDDRTLLEKIRDAIRAIISKLTGAEKRQAQTVEGKLTAALEAAARQAQQLTETQKNTANYLSTAEGQRVELSDVNTIYSIREKDAPKKTGIAYKVFYAKDGKLFPPMVSNPGGAGTPMGVWLDADIGIPAMPSKTGRLQVQAGGKGTSTGRTTLAFRPGWHLADVPAAKQFARMNPETGVKDLFPADFVWAEVEYAMDNDYQEEAMSYGYTENGKFRHSYAGLPKIPEDGYYRYRTNPNPDTVPWIITGAMRVTRILTDAETDAICRENGIEPMKRQGGPLDLSKLGLYDVVNITENTPDVFDLTEKETRRAAADATATRGSASGITISQPVEKSKTEFSMKDGSGTVYNRTAILSDSTVDRYLKDYASESSPKYAQAYIAYMRPLDYLSLTTSRTGRITIEAETQPLDAERLANASLSQPIQLRINHESGDVEGHEGRHRMSALARAGVQRVPVLFFDSSNKYSKTAIGALTLNGQDFGSSRSYARSTVLDLQPLSYANRDAIVQTFATQPTNERISERYGRETVRFAMKDPMEETDRFIALHNMGEEALRGALELGGMAMPSIALTRADTGHDTYGPISVVFGKQSVNPTNRRNRIFSGDAYTPSFPSIGYKISGKVSESVSKQIKRLLDEAGVPDGRLRPALDTDNGADKIARWGNFEEAYKNDTGMKIAFLQDTGRKISIPMMQKVYTDLLDIPSLRQVLRKIDLSKPYGDVMQWEPTIRKIVRDYSLRHYGQGIADELHPEGEELTFSQVDRIIYAANQLRRTGETKQVDTSKLEKRIDTAMRGKRIQAEYKEWLQKLGEGFVEKRGIRNNRDFFSPAGNRRSFEQLYYDYSLANIVKAMQEEVQQGKTTFITGSGNIRGAAAKSYGSIEEARQDIGRIRNMGLEEADSDEIKAFDQKCLDLCLRMVEGRGHNTFGGAIDAAEVLTETLSKYKTEDGIYRYLQREYGPGNYYNVTREIAHDAAELVKEAQQLPTSYLEAKLYRAVSMDEPLAYVVPRNMDKKLLQQMREAGLNVLTYKPGDNADRLAKVNSVEGARFSLKDSDYMEAVESGDMVTAQRMVDEAAKEAGYTVKAYHGTPNGIFTIFRDWTYFTESRGYADVYQNQGASSNGYKATAENPKTYEVWLAPKNAFDTRTPRDRKIFQDEFYQKWGNGAPLSDRALPDWTDGDDLIEFFEENGYDYDAMYIEEGGTGGYGDEVQDRGISIVIKDSAQIKSADPVTYDDEGNVIPLSERFNSADRDIRYSMKVSDYDYDTLAAKPDMRLTVIDDNLEYGSGGKTRRQIVDDALSNAAKIGTARGDGSVLIHVNDTDRDIILGRNGLKHGLDRRAQQNAAATLKAGEILQNAIRINELLPQDSRANETYVLLGAAKNEKNEPYVVEFVVNAYSDEVERVDVLYSANAKKESAARNAPEIADQPLLVTDSIISIAQLLDLARDYFPDILPESVLRHFGYDARPEGNLGKSALYSLKGSEQDAVIAELWPEFFSTEGQLHPAEQLERIAEVLEGIYDLTEYNPYNAVLDDAKAELANDIMERFFDVPQVKKTFADRAAERLEAEQAKTAQARAEARAARAAGKAAAEDAYLAGQMTQGRQMARQARRQEEQIQRIRDAIARERALRTDQIQRLKEHYRQVKADASARKADSAARSKLLRIARRLQHAKLPAVSRALLDQYIGDLDTVAKGITNRTLDKLSDLEDWYLDQKENNPDFISDPAIEQSLRRLHSRHISDLSAEEVADLTRVLLNIENEIRTQRHLIDKEDRRDVYHMGEQVIRDIYATRGSSGDFWDKYIVTETLSPLREVRRLTGYIDSDPLYKLTQDLAEGQRKMFDYQMRAQRPSARFAEDKAFTRDFSGKTAKPIEISGWSKDGMTTVKITPAMRASLYLHSLNDQNLKHIRDGGVTVPDWELYRKGKVAEAYARGTTIKLSPSQVRSIASGMTAKERAFARMAHDYFNGQSRSEINAVSEKLKGYSLAQVENYFPINTDTAFTKGDFASIKFDGTVEGMGFLKERVNAANPIMLRDANDVLQKSIQQHSTYVGLAIPIRNFNKVLGVTTLSFNDDGSRSSYDSSVQQAIKQQWGSAGYDYIEKMMRDLQSGAPQISAWAKALGKLRSNYAGAVLTLNASVAMKQAASYPTAAAVLGWRPLVRAMSDFGKVDLQTIEKYTPLQWYRSQGFSTKELGDIKQRGGIMDKLLSHKILNWVQGADLLTTRKLWKASEFYVRENNRQLAVGSDAYYKAVADVYNRVIEETQPNYTTMQRPQLLRTDDTLMSNLAMFKTQPFQNFNILYDAASNLVAKSRQGDDAALNQAKQTFGRAVSSQIAQLAVFAAMTMAWSMFRGKDDKYKDDDGEATTLSVLQAFGKDMLGGLFGQVPFGSDAWELASSKLFGDKYYGLDAVTVTALSDTISSLSGLSELIGTTFGDLADGEDVNWTSFRIKADNYFDDISKTLGIPYENIVNLYTAIARNLCIKINGKYVGNYQALKMTVDPVSKASQYFDLLYKAYTNDHASYRRVYDDMIASGQFDSGKIKNAMEARMKKNQGVESVDSLEQRYLPPEQQASYDETLREVQGSELWRLASDAQRNSAEDALYEIASGSETGQKLQEKIAGGARYGIDETDYILYRIALEMADAANEDPQKRNGSYDQQESAAAVEMLQGISDEGRGYLWASPNAKWSTSKNNPYK